MNVQKNPPSEFIGIYDADSTLIGEISYWIGARFGKRHCSLCDLTHGLFTVKSEWKSCSLSLSVPFRTYHRNDAPVDILDASGGKFPIVLARFQHGLEVVMEPHTIEEFRGDTNKFAESLASLIKNN